MAERIDLDELERLYNAPISSPLHRHVRKHLPALIAELRAARGLLAKLAKAARAVLEENVALSTPALVALDAALAKLKETK